MMNKSDRVSQKSVIQAEVPKRINPWFKSIVKHAYLSV